jgi:hypothetical protein
MAACLRPRLRATPRPFSRHWCRTCQSPARHWKSPRARASMSMRLARQTPGLAWHPTDIDRSGSPASPPGRPITAQPTFARRLPTTRLKALGPALRWTRLSLQPHPFDQHRGRPTLLSHCRCAWHLAAFWRSMVRSSAGRPMPATEMNGLMLPSVPNGLKPAIRISAGWKRTCPATPDPGTDTFAMPANNLMTLWTRPVMTRSLAALILCLPASPAHQRLACADNRRRPLPEQGIEPDDTITRPNRSEQVLASGGNEILARASNHLVTLICWTSTMATGRSDPVMSAAEDQPALHPLTP